LFKVKEFAVLLISATCMFQACYRNEEISMQPTDGYPWLGSKHDIKAVLTDKCVDTIHFNKGEVIADLGAGNGYIEVMLAMYHDSLSFYIQDIDSSVCNQDAINEVVNFYQQLHGKPFTCSFTAVIGTDSTTNLPDVGFDKILMLWTYQYIKQPGSLLRDIKEKLEEDGLLYVINPEQDYDYGRELNRKYGWNGSTVEKQISDIIDAGFELLCFSRNYEDPELPFFMIFNKDDSKKR